MTPKGQKIVILKKIQIRPPQYRPWNASYFPPMITSGTSRGLTMSTSGWFSPVSPGMATNSTLFNLTFTINDHGQKYVFCKHASLKFASVLLDHVLEPLPRLAWYTKRCPCISAVPNKATQEVEGPLKGFVSAQKSPSRVQGEGVAGMYRRERYPPQCEAIIPLIYRKIISVFTRRRLSHRLVSVKKKKEKKRDVTFAFWFIVASLFALF